MDTLTYTVSDLQEAIPENHPTTVAALMDDFHFRTFLYAVKQGATDVVKYFVKDIFVNVERTDDDDKSALDYAVENGYWDIVKYLVEDAGASVPEEHEEAVANALRELNA